MLDAAASRIDPADRGFLLGDGVFETVLVRHGAPRDLDRHLARLHDGAKVLGITLTWSDAEIAVAVTDVLYRAEEAVLRLTLTRGPSARGLWPAFFGRATLLITAGALPAPLPPGNAIVASVTRRNEHSPISRIKSLNYGDSILARRQAAEGGADEAILLNTAGRVAECCAGNLFVLDGGDWITPPVADGALPGIARARLLEAGLAREAPISCAALEVADAAFVSSSLGHRALASIEGRRLDAGVGLPF